MNDISEWVKDVFIVILSITFLEIMLPESSMSKYLKYIFAVVILAVILEPIKIFMYK